MSRTAPDTPTSHPARTTRPALTRPDDFDSFWSTTLDLLHDVPLDYRLGTVTRAPEGARLEPVRFRSLGDAEIQGYLLTRDDPTTTSHRPLLITTHGYGSQCNPALEARHARRLDVFCFDVRGYGLSRRACDVHPDGYVLTGLHDQKTSILRGAVCDYIRAAEVGLRLRRTSRDTLAFHGRSFGGALAFMAQAVSGMGQVLAVSVPTLGWAAGRRILVKAGSGHEINAYIERHPTHEAAVMRTLSYFDPVNHAEHVRCRTLVGIGMKDAIVPVETVYAIVNHMSPRPAVVELPVSHSEELEEARWQEFDDLWTAEIVALS